MIRIFFVTLFLIFSLVPAWAEKSPEADQTIADFNLTGFGERGKRTWEISGKSADVFSNTVELKNITGKLYGEKEDITLTAQNGSFDKENAKVHLENDVVITTTTGGRLNTDSLDWDRKNQVISTADVVDIKKDNIATKAQGAVGQPNLNKIALQKDVTVELSPKKEPGKETVPIIITCDGPLEIDYEKNVAVFNNNVKVEQKDAVINSDTMEVYFSKGQKAQAAEPGLEASLMGTNLDKIVAKGNVKITRGENVSYSDEAVYTASDRRVVLKGRPKLVIYTAEELNAAP